MPDPAAPAPPPAARLGAIARDAALRLAARRVEDGEPGAIDRLSRALERLDRYRNAAAAAPPFDEEEDFAAGLDAGLDDLLRRAAGDKARAPRARAGRRRATDPRGLPFACKPQIFLDRPRNEFPDIATTKGFVGRCGRRRC